MPEMAVSTWSLHRELGPMYWDVALQPDAPPDLTFGPGHATLLDAPEIAAGLGVRYLEVCHFHFPRLDSAYLAELHARLERAGVRFLTLLIDTGDVTAEDADARERDMAHIRRWIEVAAEAGARQVRVIAGDAAPDPEGAAVRRSIEGLAALRGYAASLGVGLITENWRQLTMRPAELLAILDGLGGEVGLCADFGNYKGPAKYDDLAMILPRASTIHAKAEFPRAGELDMEDFCRCLDLSRDAGFGGQYVLIFDGPGDELESLARMAGVAKPYLED